MLTNDCKASNFAKHWLSSHHPTLVSHTFLIDGPKLYNRKASEQEWKSYLVVKRRREGGGVKRQWRSVGSHLPSYSKYSALSNRVMNKELTFDNTEGVRELRRTLQPLKEVWMQIEIERVDHYEGVSVKVLLNSGATGMFADKKFVEKNGFKLEKLDKPVKIKNVELK